MKHQRLHASCSNGDPMIQISGYNHPYFDIDSLEHGESMEESIIGIKESIENSAIFCMWKNQCKIDKTTRKDIFKTEGWFKKNMRCLKNGNMANTSRERKRERKRWRERERLIVHFYYFTIL